MVDIGRQWLRNIPGVSPERDIRIPYFASFVWRGCFMWGIESENCTVDRHGQRVVMLSVIKCSFGRVLMREIRFSFSEKRVCVWVRRQESSWIVEVGCFLGGPVTYSVGREIAFCIASTPLNFVEVVVRGRFWDWNWNFNTASFCWGCCSRTFYFGLFGEWPRLSRRWYFPDCQPALLWGAWVSRAKIWVLFCALVLVQRIQLNCCGLKWFSQQ